MKCEYCNTDLKTNSSLKYHQKTARYCLIKQGLLEPECEHIIIEEHICEYCKKNLSTKHVLNSHLLTCIIKIENEEKNKKQQQIIQHNKQIEEIKNNYGRQIEELKNNYGRQIEELKIQIREKDNIIASIASQPKTVTNNNNSRSTTNNRQLIINNLIPLTEDEYKKLPEMLTPEHIEQDVLGYIQVASEFLKNKAICTDLSRKMVTHKDENGKLVTDPNMNNLSIKMFNVLTEKSRQIIGQKSLELNDQHSKNEIDNEEFINKACKLSQLRVNIIKMASGDDKNEEDDTENNYINFRIKCIDDVCSNIYERER